MEQDAGVLERLEGKPEGSGSPRPFSDREVML